MCCICPSTKLMCLPMRRCFLAACLLSSALLQRGIPAHSQNLCCGVVHAGFPPIFCVSHYCSATDSTENRQLMAGIHWAYKPPVSEILQDFKVMDLKFRLSKTKENRQFGNCGNRPRTFRSMCWLCICKLLSDFRMQSWVKPSLRCTHVEMN